MFLVLLFANSFSLLEVFVAPLVGSSYHVTQTVYLIAGVFGVLGTYLFFKYQSLQDDRKVPYQQKVSSRSHVIVALNLSFLASVFLFLDPYSIIGLMTAATLLTLSCAIGLTTSGELLAKLTADIWNHDKLVLLSFYLGRVALPYLNFAAF